MRKPASLRAFLTEAVPFFAREPDRLHVFVDEGQLVATGVPGLSHELRYVLNLVVVDYPDSPDALMLPLLAWSRVNQPELFENPARRDDGVRFEVDVNNNDTVDISVKINLTERVIARPDQAEPHRLHVTHADEPVHPWLPRQGEPHAVYLDGKQIATLPYPVGPADV